MRVFSKKEACLFLGIKLTKLDGLRRKGQLAYVQVGDRIFFLLEDLEAFIRRNRHGDSQKDPSRAIVSPLIHPITFPRLPCPFCKSKE